MCEPLRPLSTAQRLVRLAAAAALVALVAYAAPARARTKVRGVAEGSIAATDNVSSSPDNPPPTVPPRESDVYAILSPGIVLASLHPAEMHRLTYTYGASLYLLHSEASSFSNRLEYLGRFDTGQRTELTLGAHATQAHHNAENDVGAATATAVNAAFPGTGAFLLTGADELLDHSLSPEWRATQFADVTLQMPIRTGSGAPTTYEVGGGLGIDREWMADALGMEGSTRYALILNGRTLAGETVDAQSQFINKLIGRWRHDYGEYFTSRFEAGVVQVARPGRGSQFWNPAGTAAVAYVREDGDVELWYSHDVRTSLFLGQTFLIDEVRLRGALPITEHDDVVISSSAGYQHNQVIDLDGSLSATVQVFVVDAAIAWLATDSLAFSLRYQHIDQASTNDQPQLPLSFVRNNVMLGARYEFPPDKEMPRAYRAPRRVDRADEIEDAFEMPATAPSAPGPIQ